MRVLIVDDEAPARARLRRMLGRHDDVEVVGEAADASEALVLVAALAPDAVFLDVQMPETDGLALAAALPAPAPAVVFVTAHGHYAMEAFDVEAADYLLKPVSPERLERALQRLRTAPPPARLLVIERGRTRVVPWADIAWLESAGNYVQVHLHAAPHAEPANDPPAILMRTTLAALLEELGPAFVRIHRSAAVAMEGVLHVRSRGKGDATVVLRGGTELPCSRQCRADLMQRLHAGAGPARPTDDPLRPSALASGKAPR